MTSIAQLIKSYEQILRLELDIVRAGLSHSSQKGSALENATAEMLRRFLPESIGVTEGVIIDSTGFISNQMDLILYDRMAAQLFFKSDSTKIVPAEFVFAVGEVKAILNKEGYNQFFTSQNRVKNTERFFIRPHQ